MMDQVLKYVDPIPNEDAPRKRIKPHLREHILRNAAEKHGAKLDQVMAIARYRAEEIRAAEEKREMSMELALAAFEENPFRWASRAWQSRMEVGIFWTWRNSDGTKGIQTSTPCQHAAAAGALQAPATAAGALAPSLQPMQVR
mgnify:CR=1 FL=1